MFFTHLKEGWLNYLRYVFKAVDDNIKIEAERRANICIECTELQLSTMGKRMPIKGYCRMCNCAFPAMLFAPKKKCPLKKWRRKKNEDDDFYKD